MLLQVLISKIVQGSVQQQVTQKGCILHPFYILMKKLFQAYGLLQQNVVL